MGGHNKNSNHNAFKELFPYYDKGEICKQKTNNKVGYIYIYTNNHNVINMVEHLDFEYCDVTMIKGKHDNMKPKTLFFLRGATSLTFYEERS